MQLEECSREGEECDAEQSRCVTGGGTFSDTEKGNAGSGADDHAIHDHG